MIVFMNDASRYTIVIKGVNEDDGSQLYEIFQNYFADALLEEQVNPDVRQAENFSSSISAICTRSVVQSNASIEQLFNSAYLIDKGSVPELKNVINWYRVLKNERI